MIFWHMCRAEWKSEHHLVGRRFNAAARRVQPHGGLIGAVGENPGFDATKVTGSIEQLSENSLADAASAMSGRYADFIDPELWRGFVGVDVVDSRRKPHDDTIVDRDDNVVSGVAQELVGRPPIQRAVEYFRSS